MHENQELFDEAWRNGGDSLTSLLSLAQRYMNDGKHQLAAECFRDATAASKHENFRYKIEVEEVYNANKRYEDQRQITKAWLKNNRSRLRKYPISLEGFGGDELSEMIGKAISEPRLSMEVSFLALRAGEHPRKALTDILYPALGFRGQRLRIHDAELTPAIDNIVDFIENSWRVAQKIEEGMFFNLGD